MHMHPARQLLMISLITLLTTFSERVANAGTNTSTGPSGGDWGVSGKWTPSALPGTNAQPRFLNPAAVVDATIDNIVSTNMTIQFPRSGQTNPATHKMLI